MKNTFKLIMLYILFFLLGTIIFILLFHTTLFESIKIFFYRGIFLLATSCLLILLIMTATVKKTIFGKIFTTKDIILSLSLIASFNLIFFTHLPVTAERSISVFILDYLNQHPDEKISTEEMNKIFIEKYLYESGALDKRFNEQQVSGNITYQDKGYKITNQGKLLMRFYLAVTEIFGIDKKFNSENSD